MDKMDKLDNIDNTDNTHSLDISESMDKIDVLDKADVSEAPDTPEASDNPDGTDNTDTVKSSDDIDNSDDADNPNISDDTDKAENTDDTDSSNTSDTSEDPDGSTDPTVTDDMDYVDIIEQAEKNQERIKALFKELTVDEIYDIWADTFDIDIYDENIVTVIYHGSESLKKFKKECKGTLIPCICSVMGRDKKIKITKKAGHGTISPKARKNLRAFKFFAIGMIFVCIAAAVISIMYSYIVNRNFRETFYSTSSIKADSPVRVIQLSDLHGSSYGKDNERLLKRIAALEPDIIICTGDMVDSTTDDLDLITSLGKELSKIAPSYYIYGNNEAECIYDFPLNEKELDKEFGFTKDNRDESALLKLEDPFEDALENVGMKVLKNEKDTIRIRSMTVDIYGVLTSNPSSFWSYSEKSFADYIYEDIDHLKITAVHEPFIFEEFTPEFWGDLLVCGHTHGGIMRIPVLGPLYTHEGGFLPERKGDFVYGRYDAAGSPLIVSSGLVNSTVFRINNQPELVIIDINKF